MAELGSDIGGVADLSPTLGVVTGREALATNILRRLRAPLGGLLNAPTYGYDVRSLVGAVVPISVAEQRIRAQVLAEQEVHDATVDVAFDTETSLLTINISVRDAEGPFELTVTASAIQVRMLLNGYLFENEPARGETTDGLTNPFLAEGADAAEDVVFVDGDPVYVDSELVTV